MPYYSVRKPFTVLVAVLLVLVLGVISFLNMTTDLLPNIELPYLVVITNYQGASPEQVELSVTRPLESALGTAGGIINVNSVSQENASLVILEFEQSTNMDSAMIEVSASVDLVKGSLPDGAGAPMILKISPDMIPVMVASVDLGGADVQTVSEYVEETLIPAFERVSGVASVSASGLVEEEISVTLDQEKIDALNDRVLAGVDSELAEAKSELDEAYDTLIQTQTDLDEARQELTDGEEQLAGEKLELETNLAQMSAQVDSAAASLSALLSEEDRLTAEKEALSSMKQIGELSTVISSVLMDVAQQANPLDPPEDVEAAILLLSGLSEEAFAPILESVLASFPQEVRALLEGLDAAGLTALYRQSASIDLSTVEQELSAIDLRLPVLAAMKPQLEAALKEAQEGYAQLELGKMEAVSQLTKAEIEISQGKSQLELGETQLEQGWDQYESGLEQFEEARDLAYQQADLDGIITKETVSAILLAENFDMPAGYIQEGEEQYLVKVGEAFSSVEELENALLFHIDVEDVGDIRLSDVATVELRNNAGENYAKINGNPGVVLSFQKQSVASTADVSSRIGDEIDELTQQTPGLSIIPLMDQGDYIGIVVGSVLDNLMWGGLLAILVLMLFLRSPKTTLIIALSIPISLLFSVALMYFSGVTLNIISLSGLALAVGMLVDNSIVVIENIYRMRSEGMNAASAAVHGAKQVAGAIAASTLTTICVFLPIVFTEGISRELFTDMGLTIAFSLIASLIVALTLVPAMGSAMLRNSVDRPYKWFESLVNGYEKLLRICLHHKAPVLLLSVVLLVFSVWQVGNMGTAFIPEMNSPQMSLTVSMPEGSKKAESYAMADEVTDRLLSLPDIETVGAMDAGGGMSITGGTSSSGGYSTSYYLVLSDERTTTNAELEELIRENTSDLTCDISISASTMDLSALGGSGVEIEIRGQDLDEMARIGDDVAAVLKKIEGLYEISTGESQTSAETRIVIDKDAAMRKGLTVAQVFQELSQALSTESTATTLTVENKEYPVVVMSGEEGPTRETILDYTFTVADPEGEEETFTLGEIASVTEAAGVSAINRENQQRIMSVTASVDSDHNIGLISREIEQRIAGLSLPAGYSVEIAGENETINTALRDLTLVILLAVVFIYLIMVAQFQSLLSPFIVMFTIPLAFTGGLLGLILTGMELSVVSMLGFLVLAGVVVNNGIVFVDYANQLRLAGTEKYEALVLTGRRRLRPILMTALTTILAMLTMALGIGNGAEMTQPMAVVTIGGLLYATLLTLFVVPVLYAIFNRRPLKKVAIEPISKDEEVTVQ